MPSSISQITNARAEAAKAAKQVLLAESEAKRVAKLRARRKSEGKSPALILKSEGQQRAITQFDPAITIESRKIIPWCSAELTTTSKEFSKIQKWILEQLENIPDMFKSRLIHNYVRRYNQQNQNGKPQSYYANINMRKSVATLREILDKTPLSVDALNHESEIKILAKSCADYCRELVQDFDAEGDVDKGIIITFDMCAKYAESFQVIAVNAGSVRNGRSLMVTLEQTILNEREDPETRLNAINQHQQVFRVTVAKAQRGLLRLLSDKWWTNTLTKLRRCVLEHIEIAIGNVNRSKSPYVSKNGYSDWRVRKQSENAYVAMMEAVCEDGTTISLSDIVAGTTANPEKRRIELMVRCRGLEELADEREFVGYFLTLTCPSKFHGVSTKWAKETPKEAGAFLTKQWSKARAKLDRDGIERFGLRVSEPHHDGTPHWHMLMFVKPDQASEMLSIMTRYAFQVDGDEKGAKKHRFKVVEIDKTIGSATGYIAKYISKNVNGKHLNDENNVDFEAETCAGEGAKRAAAWASLWRMRQFQFFGAEKVTVWREARRIREPHDDARFEKVRAAADNGNWRAFTNAMNECAVKLDKELILCGNEYSDDIKRIRGLKWDQGRGRVITREKEWSLQRRGLGLKRSGSEPWSTGNNCTGQKNSEASTLARGLKGAGLWSPGNAAILENGGHLLDGDRAFKIRGNQLMEYELKRGSWNDDYKKWSPSH